MQNYLSPVEFQLVSAYSELLIERQGVSFSLKDLLAHANVKKSTFYYHFESKKDFEDDVLNLVFSAISAILSKDLSLESDIILSLLHFFYRHQTIFSSLVLYHPQFDYLLIAFIKETIKASEIPELGQQLVANYGFELAYAFELYTDSIAVILILWARRSFQESPETILDIIHKTVKI